MPGEAQKIDRMMECFAQRYCELNLGVFTSTGMVRSVHVLLYCGSVCTLLCCLFCSFYFVNYRAVEMFNVFTFQ